MSDSPTPEPESAFVCDCQEQMRSACNGEPFYREQEGKRYCVLHFPGKEKSADFKQALERKLGTKDFDFRGVWFPDPLTLSNFHFDGDVDFSFATFSEYTDFGRATFSSAASFIYATFKKQVDFGASIFSKKAIFSAATFSAAALFYETTFSAVASFVEATFAYGNFYAVIFSAEADFSSARFNSVAYFSNTTFSSTVDFGGAIFSEDADFIDCTLSGKMDFSRATFKDYVKFAGNETTQVFSGTSSLDLQFARIEKPDHLSFHTLSLRPRWFVNVDARKFEFINVKWQPSTSQEIQDLNSEEYGFGSAAHQLLAIACRNLAVNAEDNHRYEEASRFRYMAMDIRRRERWRGLAFWRLSWWYWLASGYGERVLQAFLVLLGILLLSALLYNHVGFARWEPKLASESDVVSARRDDIGAPLRFSHALTYSAGVMTFQKPEPRPATTAGQTVVLLETILGPVQAALLALAIRRKFMR